jgi:hypothetical protein
LEVVEAALEDPRSQKMKGKTPSATLSAQLYTTAKSGKPVTTLDATEGIIVKADRGLLAFRPRSQPPEKEDGVAGAGSVAAT